MKSQQSRASTKHKPEPPQANRLQLSSKSILQNIECAKNSLRLKPPQYCHYCCKLNDSAVTFSPTQPSHTSSSLNNNLTKIRTLAETVRPSPIHRGGILETHNLRLIEANQKYQTDKEEMVLSITNLVGQCKVYIQNYDSIQSMMCLENILKTVKGNKMVSFIEEEEGHNGWKEMEAQKVKTQFLERSMETVKRIVSEHLLLFPRTKKTLEDKYYLSLEDFNQDILNMEETKTGNQSMLELFKVRLEQFKEELRLSGSYKRTGLCDEEFEELRELYQRRGTEIAESIEARRMGLQVDMGVQGEGESGDQNTYNMMLSQCLIIEQLLSQQSEE